MGRRLSYLPVAFLLWILLSTPLNSSFVGKLLFRRSSWLKGALIYHGLKAFLLKRENSIMPSQYILKHPFFGVMAVQSGFSEES